MEQRIKIYNRITLVVIFVILPLLFYTLGYFPRRTFLKEAISVLTILAFFIMLLQFYLSRGNKNMLKTHKMSKVVKWHKVLGYIFVSILLIHPFLIILPQFFEASISPLDAFSTILSEWGSKGIKLGVIAWSLLLIIAITSLLRNHLGISYKVWRIFHGITSILFISLASFHVIYLGRHINIPMTCLIALLSIIGIILILKKYIFNSSPSKKENT